MKRALNAAVELDASWKIVGTAFVLSFLLVMLLCPEALFFKSSSFMFVQDKEIPIENLFTLISNFFHGGIQLWDRYDQMEYAYAHLTGGLYTMVNVLLAAGYIILTPFIQYPGEFLYSWFVWGFFGLTILLRTAGGYLLVRRFTSEPFVIVVSLIIFNTFLTSLMYRGFFPNNLYSYFPLLAYFILRVFDEWRLRHLLCALLAMTICVANSALFALAYFYEVVHMLIVSAVVMTLVVPERRSLLLERLRRLLEYFSEINAKRVVGTLVVCGLIMLPFLMMAQSLLHDFYIPNSGLGGTEGRIRNAFSVTRYFGTDIGRTYLDPSQFWIGALYHVQNLSGSFWMFTGVSVLVLSLIGLVMGRSPWRYAFLSTIILVIFVNDHAVINRWSAFAHWLTVLTNPFSFLLRSYHMSAILMYFMFLPLVAMGLQACWDILQQKLSPGEERRLAWLQLGLIGLLAFFAYKVLFVMRLYVLASTVLFLAFVYLFGQAGRVPAQYRGVVAAVIFLSLVMVEIKALAHYIASDDYEDRFIVPLTFKNLEKAGPFIPDFQSPLVFPYREHFRSDPAEMAPPRYTQQNLYGLFYGFMPMGRFFLPDNLYQPRHISYKTLNTDQAVIDGLKNNTSWITFAPAAVNSKTASVYDLQASRLEDKVISVEDPDQTPGVVNELPAKLTDPQPGVQRAPEYEFTISDGKKIVRRRFDQYEFRLPKDFPKEFSTTVFTRDEERMALRLNTGRKFKPTQGKLTEPYRYDIANYSKGRLIVSVPKNSLTGRESLILNLVFPEFVQKIWRNQNDDLGMTVDVPQAGWMLVRSPYTPKWEVTIDGKKAPVLKANHYFWAAPMPGGEHQVLIRYWPHSPLRILIALSVVLSLAALGIVFRKGFEEERWVRIS